MEWLRQPDQIDEMLRQADEDRPCRIRPGPLVGATYKFKLGDSLHLAAAAESRCDRFRTNDTRLSAFTAVPVEVLS